MTGGYFKNEFKVERFNLEHEDSEDFYITCWQRSPSAVPLLLIRCFIFTGCLGILLASTIMTGMSINFGFWFIYLTHWGLAFITLSSGLAVVVSLSVVLYGPFDSIMGLPWYVKAYWVLYNTSIPIAFYITVFYWIFLTALDDIDYAINPVLDIFIHAINSVLMLMLLLTTRHPSHLLHFYHTISISFVYVAFSIIYYYAGGTDPFGNVFVYPMLDWSNPGSAAITVVGSAIMLIIVHLIVVAIAVARDAVTKVYRRDSNSISVSRNEYYD